MRPIICALCLCFSLGATAQDAVETRGVVSYTFTDVPKYDVGIGASYRGDYFDVQGLFMSTKDGTYETNAVKYLFVERQESIGQETAVGARVMRIEGINTEITGRDRRDVTNRYGLRVSYSW